MENTENIGNMNGKNINVFIANGIMENKIYKSLINVKQLPLNCILFVKTQHRDIEYFQPYLIDDNKKIYPIGFSNIFDEIMNNEETDYSYSYTYTYTYNL